jgi:hypothetical protein
MAEELKSPEVNAATMRTRFLLEMMAGMAADRDDTFRQAELRMEALGGPGSGRGPFTFSAFSSFDGINRVVNGDADLAFINPAATLAVAHRGGGASFTEPQPVRTLAVLPSRDQCIFTVRTETGLTHVEDIGREKYPLKLRLRGVANHCLHNMLEDICAAAGFALGDIETWGGEVKKEGGLPWAGTPKFEAYARGDFNAVFDEGVYRWANELTPAGITVLKMSEETLTRLEEMGYRRDVLPKADYPTLPDDIVTLDFSGWPAFVHEDADDDLVRRLCAGLEARRDIIPWEGTGPLPLEIMCTDCAEAPLGAPLHRAAEKFWTEQGYL